MLANCYEMKVGAAPSGALANVSKSRSLMFETFQEMTSVKRTVRPLRPSHVVTASLSAMTALLLFGAAAYAQDATKPPKPPKASAPAAAGATGSEGGLKARVDTLEEQLVDMQVVVGTLESLAKSGASSSSPAYRAGGAVSGADGARVESLEGQVRNLSAQVQQLQEQVRSLGAVPRRSEAPVAPSTAQTAVAAQTPPSFGSTTVTPGGDDIGSMITSDPLPPVAGAPASGQSSVTTAALPPSGSGDNPKQLYESAYGYLLQKDYGAAEAAFDDFLKKFPSDALAGNAQYWLGESHFVRGQYKAAAGAFLKGYQTYAQSAKAPDSLLKLAMSLDRLGQKDAACSSYAELSTKFPNAPASIKSRATSERARVGCP